MQLHIRLFEVDDAGQLSIHEALTKRLTFRRPVDAIPALAMIELLGDAFALKRHYATAVAKTWPEQRDVQVHYCILPRTPFVFCTQHPEVDGYITLHPSYSLDKRGLVQPDGQGMLYEVLGTDPRRGKTLFSGQYSISTAVTPCA